MNTRAVARQANKPLTIELDGRKASEVPVGVTGIRHADAHTPSGRDSKRAFPAIPGHEGAGSGREAGVTTVKPDDHMIPLDTPECRNCDTCLARLSNRCTSTDRGR